MASASLAPLLGIGTLVNTVHLAITLLVEIPHSSRITAIQDPGWFLTYLDRSFSSSSDHTILLVIEELSRIATGKHTGQCWDQIGYLVLPFCVLRSAFGLYRRAGSIPRQEKAAPRYGNLGRFTVNGMRLGLIG